MNNNIFACGLAAAALAFPAAQAQSKNGAYVGTFEVTGSERDPQVTYKATVTVTLPVTKRTPDSIEAGDEGTAKVKITQYDFFSREKSADSSGHFQEIKCSLAGPMEVPAMVTGALDVDLRKKKYVMSLTILPRKEVALNCTSTRGTPKYKKNQGVAMALGTGAPGMQSQSPQTFSDPSRLAAKFTMDAAAASGGAIGPVVQEWDLKLTQ